MLFKYVSKAKLLNSEHSWGQIYRRNAHSFCLLIHMNELLQFKKTLLVQNEFSLKKKTNYQVHIAWVN
jgi:glucose-6-phosphate isomerase